jgi:uncharacterized protein (TIGR02171 family)
MALIKAAGKTFRQGAAGALAGPDETPIIANRFSYDFQMDTVEVTQAAYARLMGTSPVAPGSPYGAGERFPVYGVSWFDAALFANARSKAAGLDTVYAYDRIDCAAGGSVFGLGGMVIHLERKGFRLPTEAEWEYAARAGLDADFPWGGAADSAEARKFAWYAANAGGTTHPVGTLAANGFGLHDMGGNVMEWVNDWKGPYPDSGAADFAGARDPGPQADVPVKGGAFRYGLRELRPANRSATYTTLCSAISEYVGFRCVLGPISHPRFSLPRGGWADADPARLDIQRIGNLVEGRAAKLAFVNATARVRHLAYVDFSESPARVREFGDAADVFHPAISPDGEWVAYGTAPEGAVAGSTVYVRKLGRVPGEPQGIGPGFIPRWWVDPAAQDTFLVFTSSAGDNSQAQWDGTRTLAQRISGGHPIGEPQVWVADGAFHDGRSRDGRWLATGFRLLKVRDGSTGAVRTLFTYPENGKLPGDTSQVCNVSMAPDTTGRILFLDFGFDGKSALTGSFYDIHQIAFLAGADGKVRQWFRAPSGERGWDDLEWSNQARYAVAAATGPAGGHGHLYLLDLGDSSATRLASGVDLATPALWLGGVPDSIPTGGLDLDSLGRYNEPATDAYQGALSMKMVRFWDRHDGLELICTGSSHAYGGIDARRFTGMKSLNMAYPACGWLGQEEWARAYALPHCPKLKVLVMEAFPGWMAYPDGDFTWKPQISQTRGMRYDQSHGFWKDGLPTGFAALVRRAPAWDGVLMDSTGFVHQDSMGWGEVVEPAGADWGAGDSACQATLARMENFARETSARKVHLVLVDFPTNPAFKRTAYYGPYGPRTEVARVIVDRLRAMEGISPYVHFYDAHRFNEHDYTDLDAQNAGHLGSSGAIKLTDRLDSLVRAFPP